MVIEDLLKDWIDNFLNKYKQGELILRKSAQQMMH